MSKKRKPAEPKMWMALCAVKKKSTGRVLHVAAISYYAHKTQAAGMNDISIVLDDKYPAKEYKHSISSVIGLSLEYFTEAFKDFVDFGNDDDDRGSNQDEPIDPEPEDHGALEPVTVPALFEAFINEIAL